MLKDRIKAVILDWDETITEADTMSILSRATNDPKRWPEFVDAYMNDLERHEETYGQRKTLDDQFSFLGSLGPVEKASVQRIEAAGVFQGVTHTDLEKAAEHVRIRDGFEAFCRRLDNDVCKEILSVNWSTEFIRLALPATTHPETWQITANSLGFDEQGKGTGSVSKDKEGGIRTGMDKLLYLKRRMSELHRIKDDLVVYIGDSNTDLPCLLEADLGIVFGNNESLASTCKKYAINILPFSHLYESNSYTKFDGRLYRITHWDELRF